MAVRLVDLTDALMAEYSVDRSAVWKVVVMDMMRVGQSVALMAVCLAFCSVVHLAVCSVELMDETTADCLVVCSVALMDILLVAMTADRKVG